MTDDNTCRCRWCLRVKKCVKSPWKLSLRHLDGVYWIHPVCLWVCRFFCPSAHDSVRSVVSTVLDGLFLYLAQMVNSSRGCITCDDFRPWHILKVIQPWMYKKIAKIWHILSCLLYSTYSSDSFHIPITIPITIDHLYRRVCRAQRLKTLNNFCKVIQPWYCKKLVKYGTSWCVHFTAPAILDAVFPYFVLFTIRSLA